MENNADVVKVYIVMELNFGEELIKFFRNYIHFDPKVSCSI